MIKNILFDFDGVIVYNSQSVAFGGLIQQLRIYGIKPTLEDMFTHYLGVRAEDIIDDLEQRYAVKLDKSVVDRFRTIHYAKLAKEGKIDNSLVQLLTNEKHNFYICSSNNLALIKKLLKVLKIEDFFANENIYSIENTQKKKPDPEVYLNCIKNNELDLNESIAIEDSISGVKAAKAAGLFTYGYVGGLHRAVYELYINQLKAAGVDKIIDNFSEIR